MQSRGRILDPTTNNINTNSFRPNSADIYFNIIIHYPYVSQIVSLNRFSENTFYNISSVILVIDQLNAQILVL